LKPKERLEDAIILRKNVAEFVRSYVVPMLMELLDKMMTTQLSKLGWRTYVESREEFITKYSQNSTRLSRYENLLLHFHPKLLKRPSFLMEAASKLILHSNPQLAKLRFFVEHSGMFVLNNIFKCK